MIYLVRTDDIDDVSISEFRKIVSDKTEDRIYFQKAGEFKKIWYTAPNKLAEIDPNPDKTPEDEEGNETSVNLNGVHMYSFGKPTAHCKDEDYNENTQVGVITFLSGITMVDHSAFYTCTDVTSLILPDGVTSINGCDASLLRVFKKYYGAFEECSNLTTITIPKSVNTLGGYIFSGCDSLKSIIFKGKKKKWNAITKNTLWNTGMPSGVVVTCTDGTITL